jgi:hypothetical protein
MGTLLMYNFHKMSIFYTPHKRDNYNDCWINELKSTRLPVVVDKNYDFRAQQENYVNG